jgi:activator of HSP90 ATPase
MTFDVEKNKGEQLLNMMREQGQSMIRIRLAEYIRLLKEEFSQGLILPTKDSNEKIVSTTTTNCLPLLSLPTNTSAIMKTCDVKIHDRFHCSKKELFLTFCDLERVKAFTHNSVSNYDCKQGGFFSLFSDNITGRFLAVVPYDRLDMLWRFKSWPNEHHSRVSILFHDDNDQSKIVIQQTNVPSQFYDNTMVRG